MKNIRKAANKEQYWRAAAWALERKYPEEYARRGPDAIARNEVVELLIQLTRVIVEEVPVSKLRKSLLKRLRSLSAAVEKGHKGWEVPNDDKQ